jgi:DNA-binding CsgD family transcriptional regulator
VVSHSVPSINCKTAVSYKRRSDATRTRAKLKNDLLLFSRITYCGECDSYHLDATQNIQKFDFEVLQLIAQGLRRTQIKEELKVNNRRLDDSVSRLYRKLYASNIAQLACVAMSLCVLNPSSFVPELKEKLHD